MLETITAFLNTALFTWGLLPLFIFASRVVDVSLGTLRVMYISKNFRVLATAIGFVEVMIWLLAIKQIMQNLDNIFCYFAYAGGFATGTFFGMYLEERLSVGKVLIRVITRREGDQLVEALKSTDYNFTDIDAQGAKGPVKVIFGVIERNDLGKIVEMVKAYNSKAVYSIEDIRFVSSVSKDHPILPIPGKKRYGLGTGPRKAK